MRYALLVIVLLLTPSLFSADKPSDIEKPGWKLTFHDEFDGDKLDETRWFDRYPEGRYHSNNELQYYAPDGYKVKDGILSLIGQQRELGKRHYTSGMIASFDHFSQQYGWFEIRARFPKGKGYWPAFWLLPADKTWPPELDILEILGHEPDTIYFTTHRHDEHKRLKSDSHHWKGPDFSADFHTIACDWQKGLVIWYVDGIEQARTTKGVPDIPMYILANLAIGGDWPGNPDATTVFPGTMDVDYIRVYQRAAP